MLAGAAGALTVVAVESVARATPAHAATGGNVILGEANTETTNTSILNTTSGDLAFQATATGLGTAIMGSSSGGQAVRGSGGSGGVGVQGFADGNGIGVVGDGGSSSGTGVQGVGGSPDGIGVDGSGAGTGAGVLGTGGSGGGAGVSGRGGGGSGVGVVGTGGNNSGTGMQSTGGSPNGPGVVGVGTGSGDGVLGATSGAAAGVQGIGSSSSAVGVLASNGAGGTALQVTGPAVFSRSGAVVIPSGKTTATVTPPGGLSSSALVLALMQNVAGGVMVKAAVPNQGAGTVQIVLNKAPASPASAKVASFVVN